MSKMMMATRCRRNRRKNGRRIRYTEAKELGT